MTIRKFQTSDFGVYRSWFADPALNRALGPLDEEWLAHVLSDTQGSQYACTEDGELVAVIGLLWGDPAHPYQVITDLAVAPHLQRRGIGRRALARLMIHLKDRAYPRWVAYVAVENVGARRFFGALGWREAGEEEGMVEVVG